MVKLISTTIMILQNLFLVKNKGSKNRLCAHGWAGQTQHLFSGRRISQSEIRNSAAAETLGGRIPADRFVLEKFREEELKIIDNLIAKLITELIL